MDENIVKKKLQNNKMKFKQNSVGTFYENTCVYCLKVSGIKIVSTNRKINSFFPDIVLSSYKGDELENLKKAKDDFRRQIGFIKTEVEKFTLPNDKDYILLKKKEAELLQTVMVFDRKEKERLNLLAEDVTELKKIYSKKLNTVYGNSFVWRFEFPEVLTSDGDYKGFDLIIGNPPYFNLNQYKVYNEELSKNFKSFSNSSDIYCMFLELAKKIGSQYAQNHFIVSNKWLTATYGDKTRKYLSENTSDILIIDFNKFKVFDEATVDTCLVAFSNKNGKRTDYIAFDIKEKEESIVDFLNNIKLSTKKINLTNSWNVAGFDNSSIREKIELNGKPLMQWEVKFFRGITTGYNEAFVIDEDTKNRLIIEDKKNKEIIKPLLRGRDIKKFEKPIYKL